MFWYSKSHRNSGQKSTPLYAKLAVIAIRKTVCCWMTVKCSAEPKRRDVAQIAVFEAEPEPLWRKDRMHPKWTKSGFQYPSVAFLYALRSASYGITSRDFVCHRSPHHSQNRLTLWGRSPQSPERRDVHGERCSYRRPRDGKRERENSSKSPKMRAEYKRICEAKSVGVRAESGSA